MGQGKKHDDGAVTPTHRTAPERKTTKRPRAAGDGSVSRQSVQDAIDRAEMEFRWCWDMLAASLDGRAATDEDANPLDFQLRLFDALAALEDQYHAIRALEKRLAVRGRHLDRAWLKKRKKTLGYYKRGIEHALAIGRALGDGFVWMFYERDRDLLAQHRDHQRQRLLPTGVGRAGERATIEKLQGLGGKFLVHHGITSFLRLGDFSFIDPSTGRVASFGEVKTQAEGEYLYMHAALVTGDRAMVPGPTRSGAAHPELTPDVVAKLARQRKAMENALLKSQEPQAHRVLNQSAGFRFDALQALVAKSHDRHFEYVQAGPSLILGAFRHARGRSLGRRLLDSGNLDDGFVGDLAATVRKIGIIGREDNGIEFGTIAGGPDEFVSPFSSIPFLWWPIGAQALEDILFERVMITYIYNPAHVWEAVEQRGFELVRTKGGRVRGASRSHDKGTSRLENFEMFHYLITRGLVAEDTVFTMLDQLIEETAQFRGKGPARVELYPRFSRRRFD